MQFRTELHLPQSEEKFSSGFKFLTIGSCFSDVIGQRLHEHKLDTLVNPFGTIFNPISQFELIEAALAPHEQEELPMTEQNGLWYAYGFHSAFSAPTREELQTRIDEMLQIVKSHLSETNVVFFTFGTALVYQLVASDRIVANCHKMPAQNFTKRLLLTEEIVSGFAQTFALLKQFNPKIKAVLTVSPVRHIKETLPLNSVSKSVLRVACHYLAELMPDVQYFPAYELLIDDLRDYRFYKDDLLHPSAMAEQYVWEKFSETYFDSQLKQFTKEWESVLQALHHKPFNTNSAGHQDFLRNLLARLEGFNKTVNCTREIDFVKKQLLPYKKLRPAKKAPKELVDLLTALAASDVMTDTPVPVKEKPSPEEAILAEQQLHKPLETDLSFSEPEETNKQDAIEAGLQPVTTEAVAPVSGGKKERVSKSKKRRDKRKAKLQATREAQPVIEEETKPENSVTESAIPTAEVNMAEEIKHTKRKTKPRTDKKPGSMSLPEAGQETAGQPQSIIDSTPTVEPVQRPKAKPGRKKGAKTDSPVSMPTLAVQDSNLPDKVVEPTLSASTEETKLPATLGATGVGALLTALAGAQAPGKPMRGRPAKKTMAPQAPAESGNAPIADQQPSIAKKQDKKGRKTAMPNTAAPELPFGLTPESVIVPVTAAQPAALPAKEPRNKDTRKENNGPKKGKAKRIVLKKPTASKSNNQ